MYYNSFPSSQYSHLSNSIVHNPLRYICIKSYIANFNIINRYSSSCRFGGNAVGYTYSSAGVSVQSGDQFVESIRNSVASTHSPLVLEGIGGFGALFDLHALKMRQPVLVSGTDGVGTKLLVSTAWVL